jgi:hypothetical protein
VKIVDVTTLGSVTKAVDVEEAPLQLPGRDTRLQTIKVAGPESRLDTRMYFDARELEGLLEIARASRVGRVEMGMVGLVVETYRKRKRDGGYHDYQVWKLEAARIAPEEPGIVKALCGGNTPR